ncbi:MAG: tRNA lysidine(34) synthetase TilS [Clostridia bacterium]|nr:tRNA lysidine(34) synthetase TilS [Clostridia bacterium]
MTASEIILKYAPQTGVVGIGVSGGADSMVLLHIAIKTLGAERIEVLHVEHGIRGQASVDDAEFVKNYCKSNGVKFSLYTADIPSLCKKSKRSEESEARIFRHAVYLDFARKNSSVVLLGHHKDDRKESILMHLLRGCAISGLVGMTECDGHIVRPLIGMSRKQIEEYALSNGIKYVTDSTNLQTVYNRNYVRNVLIPAIDERYDSDALLRLSDMAKENEKFMERFVNTERITEDEGWCLVPLDCFSDTAVASRYVLKACALAGLAYDVESKHVSEVIELASMENGSRISLPHSFVAIKEYGYVAIGKHCELIEDEEEFCMGFTPFGEGTVTVLQTDEAPCKGKLIFDADKVPMDAVIRTRRDGDVFKPYKGKTKKLKDYFIDKKIPLRKRDFIPVIASGNEVLLVADVEISDKIKVDESTLEKYEFVYEKQ